MSRYLGAHTRIGSDDKHGSFGLRRLIAFITGLAFFASLMAAAPANATDDTATTGDQVCQGLDSGKIDTTGDPKTVTLTAPEGKLIDKYCVKAGSENSGDGPVYVVVDPPVKELTISYPGGKDISHYSVSYVDAPSCTTHPNMPGCVPSPPPPPNCTTNPTMPGCPTPPPPVPPTDVCPEMGVQPPGTTCATPPVPPTETSSTELTKIWGNVRKVDKCGRAGDSFYAKRVKYGKYLVKGKVVREGVWLKARTLVVKVKFVSTTKKHVAAGKDTWTLRFTNKPCATPPKHLPPTGA